MPVYEQPRGVPLTRRARHAPRNRLQREVRSGRGELRLPVRVPLVVQYLHLAGALPDVVPFLCGAIKNPAVARRRDLPIEPKIEVAELLPRDDVAGARDRKSVV